MTERRRRPPAGRHSRKHQPPARRIVQPRIIGGHFRGRRLRYLGDPHLRPMKDRVREAVFNLLGPSIEGTHAVDLFAGTGALGLEALSRGAARATFIEQHRGTARVLGQNVAALGVEKRCELVTGDTFVWVRRLATLGPLPWTVFCSPPYDFYARRLGDMLALLGEIVRLAPGDSQLAVESDARFDFGLLPHAAEWDVRAYPPAVVGIYRKSRSP